ncbi:hypothetical protein TRICHSKD4_6244 [Roseibium sp. TrichSKD4]|nr:hypothetical protein TRICHSKD4_6244 [Roseibium sp. TrichSKD4]
MNRRSSQPGKSVVSRSVKRSLLAALHLPQGLVERLLGGSSVADILAVACPTKIRKPV